MYINMAFASIEQIDKYVAVDKWLNENTLLTYLR